MRNEKSERVKEEMSTGGRVYSWSPVPLRTTEEPRGMSLRVDPLRADGKAAALFCGFPLVASFPWETLNALQFWLP